MATYFKRGASLFVRDKDGERPIAYFEEKNKTGH
jgi:hypothetical protein